MSEENKQTPQGTQGPKGEQGAQGASALDMQKYLDKIDELKKSSISKEQYEKDVERLRVENKQLLDTLTKGGAPNAPHDYEKEKEELRAALFNRDKPLSNRDFIDKSLKLRKAIIESEGYDPFVPQTIDGRGEPLPSNIEQIAANTAAGLEELVEASDGDDAVFRGQYESRVKG